MKKGPTIRHTSHTEETRAIKKIINTFIEHMSLAGNRLVTDKKVNKKDLAVGDAIVPGVRLLNARKKLAGAIKSGMLEKKNMEPEIAVYAAIVWFLRLEKSKRDKIIDEWG